MTCSEPISKTFFHGFCHFDKWLKGPWTRQLHHLWSIKTHHLPDPMPSDCALVDPHDQKLYRNIDIERIGSVRHREPWSSPVGMVQSWGPFYCCNGNSAALGEPDTFTLGILVDFSIDVVIESKNQPSYLGTWHLFSCLQVDVATICDTNGPSDWPQRGNGGSTIELASFNTPWVWKHPTVTKVCRIVSPSIFIQ